MPTLEYQAQSQDGSTVKGLAVGPSLDQVLNDLGRKGMQVTQIGVAVNPHDPLASVQAAQQVPQVQEPMSQHQYSVPQGTVIEGPSAAPRTYMETSVVGPLVGKVGLTHLAFFFRQLATMLEAGVPYVQCLDTLANQSRSPKLAQVLREFRGHVEAGRPISAGMQRYPEVFSPVMISLVRAGEEGGFLDRALEIVADYLDQEIRLRNLYRRVTFYPKLQVVASVAIILAANAILASLKTSTRLWSPLTTPSTWIWLGPLIIGIFLFLRLGLANPQIKHTWDLFASNLPYIGNTMRQLAMARFGRAFGALYRGGVSVPQSLKLSADSCGNEWLRSLMYPAISRLEAGESIGKTFRQTGAFSPIVLDMVDTGERTGNLDQMLGKMADFYEDESATRSTQTALVIGVLLGLLVAAYVLLILMNFWGGYGAQYQQHMQ